MIPPPPPANDFGSYAAQFFPSGPAQAPAGPSPQQLLNEALAPRQAAVDAAQRQFEFQTGRENEAINSFTTQLAKLLGGDPGHGAYTPEFAAALGLEAQRNASYQHYLDQSKINDERLSIAAEAPTLYRQILDSMTQRQAQQDHDNLSTMIELRKLWNQEQGISFDQDVAWQKLVDSRDAAKAAIKVKQDALKWMKLRFGVTTTQQNRQFNAKQRQDAAKFAATMNAKNAALGLPNASLSKTMGYVVDSTGQPFLNKAGKPIPVASSPGKNPRLPNAQLSKLMGQLVNSAGEPILRNGRPQPVGGAGLTRGLTPYQQLQIRQAAVKKAGDAFRGTLQSDVDAAGRKTSVRVHQTYQGALNDLVAGGTPLAVARKALARYWNVGAPGATVIMVNGRRFVTMPWERPGEGRPLGSLPRTQRPRVRR